MPQTPSPAPGAQAAPFGQSPVTGPSPNKGFEAAAVKQVGVVVKQLTALLQTAGATSEVGKDVLKALNILTKHVPSGAVTPADERQSLERQMMANTQNNQQAQMLKQMQAGGQQAQAA